MGIRLKKIRFAALLGLALLVYGAWIMAGNLGFAIALPYALPVLGSGAAIALAGAALLLAQAPGEKQRRGQLFIGIALLVLAAVMRLSGTFVNDPSGLPIGETVGMLLLAAALISMHVASLPAVLVQIVLYLVFR